MIVGQFASVGKTAHAFADFEADESVVDFLFDIVGFNDVIGNAFDGDFHMFITREWCFTAEAFDVDVQSGTRWGDGGIGQQFEGGEIGCFGALVSKAHNTVSANG